MSVQLLHQDANGLIEKIIHDRSRTLAQGLELAKLNDYERLVRRVPPDIEEMNRMVKADVNHFEGILKHLGWKASASAPTKMNITFENTSVLFGRKVIGTIFVYQNAFYAVKGPYTEDEAEQVLLESIRKKKEKAGYLVARKDIKPSEISYTRLAIADEVKMEVWRRDRGRCVKCESVHNLEYDHIIPVSRGGSSTARNVQLLCESCNRRKSNSIG